uniref:Secreted protein n=1 Tax=Arundo donax TaxID=35708 RepID=A0A0A9G526_ARUDO
MSSLSLFLFSLCSVVKQPAIMHTSGPGEDSSVQSFCPGAGTQWKRWRSQRWESQGCGIENGEKSVNLFVLQVEPSLKAPM